MTNLKEITKSLGTFTIKDKNSIDNIIDRYEKAGLTASSKLAKIAQHGFTFFEKNDLIEFAKKAVEPYLENAEFENVRLWSDYDGKYVEKKQQIKLGEKVDFVKREAKENELFAIIISPNISANMRGSDLISSSRNYKRKTPVSVTIDEISVYPYVPPIQVVDKIAEANSLNVFDKLFVLDIQEEKPEILQIIDSNQTLAETQQRIIQQNVAKYLDDPIVVGWIKEKPDTYFYITAWDKNIELSQILNQDLCLTENQPKLIK
jgi:hypothetical protein